MRGGSREVRDLLRRVYSHFPGGRPAGRDPVWPFMTLSVEQAPRPEPGRHARPPTAVYRQLAPGVGS